MLRNILLSAVALSFLGGTAAMAQSTDATAAGEKPAVQSRESRGIKRLDANKDGAISLDEFGSRRAEGLKKADANGDGVLSQEELADFIQKRDVERRVRKLTRMLDVDGDGEVTLAELANQNEKRFALMDANNDGKISQEEMQRAKRFMGHKQMHRGAKHSQRSGRHGNRFHQHRMHKAADGAQPSDATTQTEAK